MTDPKPPNPNATIQLDQVDVDLVNLPPSSRSAIPAADPSEGDLAGASARKVVPPPLPPAAPASTAAPKDSGGKGLALGAVFLMLLGAAVAGGLYVGGVIGAHPEPAPSASTAATTGPTTAPSATEAPTTFAPVPAASSAAPNVVMPTVEIK